MIGGWIIGWVCERLVFISSSDSDAYGCVRMHPDVYPACVCGVHLDL